MKYSTFIIKSVISIILAISLTAGLASCSGSKKNVPDDLYDTFTLNIGSDKNAKYLIHFLKEDVDVASAYTKASSNGYITFSSDEDGNATVDLKKEFDKFALIMKKSSDIKIVVSSEDDPFIRNPLSDTYKLRLYVVEGENGEPVIMSPEASVNISVSNDKEANGISLAFPNASFIIKLDVSHEDIEIKDDTKFEVFLYNDSDVGAKTKIGRVCRGFNYWEAPFYKSEIASKTFTLVIKEFASDKEIDYEGYPMTFSFNEQGLCSQGSIIHVKTRYQSDAE